MNWNKMFSSSAWAAGVVLIAACVVLPFVSAFKGKTSK